VRSVVRRVLVLVLCGGLGFAVSDTCECVRSVEVHRVCTTVKSRPCCARAAHARPAILVRSSASHKQSRKIWAAVLCKSSIFLVHLSPCCTRVDSRHADLRELFGREFAHPPRPPTSSLTHARRDRRVNRGACAIARDGDRYPVALLGAAAAHLAQGEPFCETHLLGR
jgi:hypothetical protein